MSPVGNESRFSDAAPAAEKVRNCESVTQAISFQVFIVIVPQSICYVHISLQQDTAIAVPPKNVRPRENRHRMANTEARLRHEKIGTEKSADGTVIATQ